MITMHARPRQTDKQTEGHHGNRATIRSNERVTRYKFTSTKSGQFAVSREILSVFRTSRLYETRDFCPIELN